MIVIVATFLTCFYFFQNCQLKRDPGLLRMFIFLLFWSTMLLLTLCHRLFARVRWLLLWVAVLLLIWWLLPTSVLLVRWLLLPASVLLVWWLLLPACVLLIWWLLLPACVLLIWWLLLPTSVLLVWWLLLPACVLLIWWLLLPACVLLVWLLLPTTVLLVCWLLLPTTVLLLVWKLLLGVKAVKHAGITPVKATKSMDCFPISDVYCMLPLGFLLDSVSPRITKYKHQVSNIWVDNLTNLPKNMTYKNIQNTIVKNVGVQSCMSRFLELDPNGLAGFPGHRDHRRKYRQGRIQHISRGVCLEMTDLRI